MTGTSASNPWPGTYDWTLTIDNVTDKGDYTTIDVTMVIKNATWKTNNLSDYSQVSESDTKIVGYISVYVINKNIANKSYNDRQEEGSVVEWANATWDANGVLEKRSILFGNSGGYSLEALSRKGIPGYPTLFLVAFTAVAVGLIVKKKLRSGAS